jgi:hypothetical protein
VGRGREELLRHTESHAISHGWRGIFGQIWSTWDLALVGDPLMDVKVWTATEDLGGGRRFTRARLTADASPLALAVLIAFMIWATILVVTSSDAIPKLITASAILALLLRIEVSRRRSLNRVVALLQDAGASAQLEPVELSTLKTGLDTDGRSTNEAGCSRPVQCEVAESDLEPETA